MITSAERKAAFDAVKGELLSLIPFAFRSMVKPYVTDDVLKRISDAALDAAHAKRA
jgi:hypothetical protein